MSTHLLDGFDPTGLSDVRARMERETTRRWTMTALAVKRAIVADDVLGIGPKAPRMAQPTADKAVMFGRWLDEHLMRGVIGYDAAWIKPHVDEASSRAVARSLRDAGPDDESRDDRGRWTSGGAHWFTPRADDPFVYHGTSSEHLEGIKQAGLQAFMRTYFATDPKVAMQYGFRSNLHHSERGRGKGGVLLRVRKEHVDPEQAALRSPTREDFWSGPSEISPDKIEMRMGGQWVRLTTAARAVSRSLRDAGPDDEPRNERGEWTAGARTGKIKFSSLPDDMQDIISQFIWGESEDREVPKTLPLKTVKVSDIPVVPLDEHDRGTAYARAMNLKETPPIIIAYGHFLDGKHRAFQAREQGVKTLPAIDLTDLMDREYLSGNSMGKMGASRKIVGDSGPSDEPRDDQGKWTTLYHGTGQDKPHSAWWTTSRSLAENYATTSAEAFGGVAKVFKAKALIKRPHEVDENTAEWLPYESDQVDKLRAAGHDVITSPNGHDLFVIDPSILKQVVKDQANLGFLLPGAAPSARVCHAASVSGLATICDHVSQRAHASVAAGLLAQAKPAQIARLLDKAFGEGLRRSRMLAEHCITMAYSQSTLDALESMDVQFVGTISEARSGAAGRSTGRRGGALRGSGMPGSAGMASDEAAKRAAGIVDCDHTGGALTDYDPDEPRDDKGRWAAGAGPGAAYLVPTIRWRGKSYYPRRDSDLVKGDVTRWTHGGAWSSISDPAVKAEVAAASRTDGSMLQFTAPGGKLLNRTEARQYAEENGLLIPGGFRQRELIAEQELSAAADPAHLRFSKTPSMLQQGVTAVSPIVQNTDFAGAMKALGGEKQHLFEQASAEIDKALGLEAKDVPVLGAWSDGAENSLLTIAPNADWDKLATSAAMKGHIADQRAVLVFLQGAGDAVLYSFRAMDTPNAIHAGLLEDGVAFHSIAPDADGKGATVYVADLDRSAYDAVAKSAERFNARVQYATGRAEFIGSDGSEGSDRQQRDAARGAYEKVIGQSTVPGVAGIWDRVHSRWGAAKALGDWLADTGQERKARTWDRWATRRLHAGPFLSDGQARQFLADGPPMPAEPTRAAPATATPRPAVPSPAPKSLQGLTMPWEEGSLATTDAARKSAQPKHPRSGQFVTRTVGAREWRRSKRTGQFRRQGLTPGEQRREELSELRFSRIDGKLDILTQNDDRVCMACQEASDNGPYTINQARSLLPLHFGCRCLFVAAGAMALDSEIIADVRGGWSWYPAFDFDASEPRDDHGRWVRALSEEAYQRHLGDPSRTSKEVNQMIKERHEKPPPDWSKGVSLFHGTSSKAYADIQKHGLKPHGGPGGDEWAKQRGMSVATHMMEGGRATSVYMSDDADLAKSFAEIGSRMTHSTPVLLEIDVPGDKAANLKRDEFFIGMPASHAYRYEGSIPPAWIHKAPLFTPGHGGGISLDAAPPTKLYAVIFVDGHEDVADYNPDEPRNPKGEWTTGAGDFAPHQVAELTKLPLMEGDAPYAKGSRNVEDVARELVARSQAQLKKMGVAGGKITVDNTTPARDEMLAGAVALEASAALREAGNAADWYKGKIDTAMRLAALEHPEVLTDKNARSAFSAAMAITSMGETVDSNVRLAEAAYAGRDKAGHFPETLPASAQGPDMLVNFKKYNGLVDEVGASGATEFLSKQMTVRQLGDFGYKFSKLPKDAMVSGSAIFGPKVGNGFYQNLMGNFQPVTQDLWFMRTFGRLAGTLMDTTSEAGKALQRERFTAELKAAGEKVPKGEEAINDLARSIYKQHERDYAKFSAEYKSGQRVKGQLQLAAQALVHGIDGIQEQPGGGKQRLWREGIVNRAREIMAGHGHALTNADLQATIWYPEKTLWERMGSKGPLGGLADYASGFEKLMRAKGHTDAEIAAALRAPSRRP